MAIWQPKIAAKQISRIATSRTLGGSTEQRCWSRNQFFILSKRFNYPIWHSSASRICMALRTSLRHYPGEETLCSLCSTRSGDPGKLLRQTVEFTYPLCTPYVLLMYFLCIPRATVCLRPASQSASHWIQIRLVNKLCAALSNRFGGTDKRRQDGGWHSWRQMRYRTEGCRSLDWDKPCCRRRSLVSACHQRARFTYQPCQPCLSKYRSNGSWFCLQGNALPLRSTWRRCRHLIHSVYLHSDPRRMYQVVRRWEHTPLKRQLQNCQLIRFARLKHCLSIRGIWKRLQT